MTLFTVQFFSFTFTLLFHSTIQGGSVPRFAQMFEQSEDNDTFIAEQTTLPLSTLDNQQSRFVLQQVPRNRNSLSCNPTVGNSNNNNNRRSQVMSESENRFDNGGTVVRSASSGVTVRSNSQKSVTKLPRGMSTTQL